MAACLANDRGPLPAHTPKPRPLKDAPITSYREIDSSVSLGTRIILTIPAGLAERRRRPAVTAARGGPPSETSDEDSKAAPLRILLADDHKMFRKGLANLLREHPDLEVREILSLKVF